MIQIQRLRDLCKQPDSAVTLSRRPVHLALQPLYLDNLNAGIFSILNNKLNMYYPELNGILMGYDKLKLKKRTGNILNDQPYIHIDIQADFYLFVPQKGVTLRGRVNKKSAGHVGCLVHDTFNASLIPPVGTNLSTWCGARAELGQQVTFTTTAVSYGDKLPIIQGRLSEEGLDIEQDHTRQAVEEVEKFEEYADYDSGIDSIGKEKRKSEDDEELEISRKRQRKEEKKKRKQKEREEEEKEQESNDTASPPKKKKKEVPKKRLNYN